MEVWGTLSSVIAWHLMVMRVPFIMMNWLHWKAESSTGIVMERKVLQWNWYLSELLNDQDIVIKVTAPSHREQIAQFPIIPTPKMFTSPPIEVPI